MLLSLLYYIMLLIILIYESTLVIHSVIILRKKDSSKCLKSSIDKMETSLDKLVFYSLYPATVLELVWQVNICQKVMADCV